MRLTELDPVFVTYRRTKRGIYQRVVKTLDKAQGVRFLCPKCYRANGGRRGTHQVVCWSRSRGVPDDAFPGPGRWRLEGAGFHDLTLEAEPGHSRSVLLLGGCAWHGYVALGAISDA